MKLERAPCSTAETLCLKLVKVDAAPVDFLWVGEAACDHGLPIISQEPVTPGYLLSGYGINDDEFLVVLRVRNHSPVPAFADRPPFNVELPSFVLFPQTSIPEDAAQVPLAYDHFRLCMMD